MNGKTIAYCCLVTIVALYVVGAVSVPPGSLRHEIQTLPLWIPVIGGFQRREWAKWTALPCFIFWLVIMSLIWLFLLGLANIVSGRFFPTEVVMTVIVGLASTAGIATCFRWRTSISAAKAAGLFAVCLGLQLLAFRLSLNPYIARR